MLTFLQETDMQHWNSDAEKDNILSFADYLAVTDEWGVLFKFQSGEEEEENCSKKVIQLYHHGYHAAVHTLV